MEIIQAVRCPIRPARHRARAGCSGAAAGTPSIGVANRRTADRKRLTSGTSAITAFVCSAVPSSKSVAGGEVQESERSPKT